MPTKEDQVGMILKIRVRRRRALFTQQALWEEEEERDRRVSEPSSGRPAVLPGECAICSISVIGDRLMGIVVSIFEE